MFKKLGFFFLFLFFQFSFAFDTPVPEFVPSLEKPFNGKFNDLAYRAIIIYDENCLSCLKNIGLAKDSVFELAKKNPKWENGFVWLARYLDNSLVQHIVKTYLDNKIDYTRAQFIFVDKNNVIRQFQSDCQEPIDTWSMAWLYKGIEEAPEVTQPPEEVEHYPLTGHWWSVDGDWHPTREKTIRHLFKAPLHTGSFEEWWLNLLTYDELQSVHSDHHRELQKTGKVKWEFVNKPKTGFFLKSR